MRVNPRLDLAPPPVRADGGVFLDLVDQEPLTQRRKRRLAQSLLFDLLGYLPRIGHPTSSKFGEGLSDSPLGYENGEDGSTARKAKLSTGISATWRCPRLAQRPRFAARYEWTIIAEAGATAATFPSEKHLASWVGACPGDEESAQLNLQPPVTAG